VWLLLCAFPRPQFDYYVQSPSVAYGQVFSSSGGLQGCYNSWPSFGGLHRFATEVQAHQVKKPSSRYSTHLGPCPTRAQTASPTHPLPQSSRSQVASHVRSGLRRIGLAAAQRRRRYDGGCGMTVFHFLNCAFLTFGPHVVYYSATPLYPPPPFPASPLSLSVSVRSVC
jgi:hypothetical protein